MLFQVRSPGPGFAMGTTSMEKLKKIVFSPFLLPSDEDNSLGIVLPKAATLQQGCSVTTRKYGDLTVKAYCCHEREHAVTQVNSCLPTVSIFPTRISHRPESDKGRAESRLGGPYTPLLRKVFLSSKEVCLGSIC